MLVVSQRISLSDGDMMTSCVGSSTTLMNACRFSACLSRGHNLGSFLNSEQRRAHDEGPKRGSLCCCAFLNGLTMVRGCNMSGSSGHIIRRSCPYPSPFGPHLLEQQQQAVRETCSSDSPRYPYSTRSLAFPLFPHDIGTLVSEPRF